MGRKMTDDERLHAWNAKIRKDATKRSSRAIEIERMVAEAFPEEEQRLYEVHQLQTAEYLSRRRIKPLSDNRLAIECINCEQGIATVKEGGLVVYLKPKSFNTLMGGCDQPGFYSNLFFTENFSTENHFIDECVLGVCPQCAQQHRISVFEVENLFHQCGIQTQKDSTWLKDRITFKSKTRG